MGVFGPVVGVPTDLAAGLIPELAHRGRIGFQAVGDDRLCPAMTFQSLAHEPQSGGFIAGFGDIALKHLTLVIHGAPEVMHLAVDLHVDLVEVPAPMPEALHTANPLTPDICGKQRTEPVPPKANGFVTDIYAAFE